MRTFMAGISAALLIASTAFAQDPGAVYPNRPIKIIVCVPAGGGVDTVTRIVAEGLHQKLGQPVIVENRAGAAGNIGAEAVFTSEPDGYTLLAAQPAPLTVNPLLYKKINFDPTQFVPGDDHDLDRQCPAGASGFSRKDSEGIYRLCESESGQGQLRVTGNRYDVTFNRGFVRADYDHQAGARPLQGDRARAQRHYRKPRRFHFHGVGLRDQTA